MLYVQLSLEDAGMKISSVRAGAKGRTFSGIQLEYGDKGTAEERLIAIKEFLKAELQSQGRVYTDDGATG